MEQWNGTMEWNGGMEQWNDHAHVHCNCTTILHTDGLAYCDDLYPSLRVSLRGFQAVAPIANEGIVSFSRY